VLPRPVLCVAVWAGKTGGGPTRLPRETPACAAGDSPSTGWPRRTAMRATTAITTAIRHWFREFRSPGCCGPPSFRNLPAMTDSVRRFPATQSRADSTGRLPRPESPDTACHRPAPCALTRVGPWPSVLPGLGSLSCLTACRETPTSHRGQQPHAASFDSGHSRELQAPRASLMW